MNFQDSRTYQNVITAYFDQLQANAKYSLFGKKASQEDLMELFFAYETISRNEMFIAERLRRILFEGEPSTLDNLIEARDNEATESNLYRDYARIAAEEGYNDISSLLSGVANIKLNHNATFDNFIKEIQRNQLFCKPEEGLWICLGCGNILSGECAPEICPVCGYPQGYYMFYRPL